MRRLRRAAFLDRDGVLVRTRVVDGLPVSIRDVTELELEPGAQEACRVLRARGFLLVVVTNQPDVARGMQTAAALDRIHGRLRDLLPLDEIVVCPHDDSDGCTCRKPQPGMLLAAAERLGIDLDASFMIGDRWRDIVAGRRATCTTVFLNREYSEAMVDRPDVTVRDVGEATAWILGRHAHGDAR